MAVITLSAAGMVLSDPALPEGRRRLMKRLLIFFAITAAGASDVGRLFGAQGVEWAKAYGVFLWPSVVVTIATLSLAVKESPKRALEPLSSGTLEPLNSI